MRVSRKRRVQLASAGAIATGVLFACALLPSRASAQAAVQPGCSSTLVAPYNAFTPVIGGVVGATNSISSVIGTMNTAFQAQGDAFAVGLPDAKADALAGGVWGRMIGGRVENQASGTFNGSISPGTGGSFSNFPGGPGSAGSINCKSDIRQDYAGFQLGQDLARLNLSGSGATLHLGVTGGFAQSRDQDLGGSGFNGSFQVPFAGLYAVYTNGNFFADGLLRADYYQMNLSAASAALGNQNLNGFGLSETISAGYKIDIGNNWFVQPSVSGIHSRTKIDTLDLPGGAGNDFNPLYLPPATVNFSDIESWLGRAGLEIGTSFTAGNVVWEPFATASVWHEFAGNVTANYSAPEFYVGPGPFHALLPCGPGNLFVYPNGCGNAVSGRVSATRVGTFGQYSVGVFGEMPDTPWLGYFRIDYKDGANIEALGFNAGVRYQFDPTPRIAAGTLFDGPARQAPYDWTGLYIGGFLGAGFGKSNWNFPQTATSADSLAAGAIGGATLGYNKQFDRWVVGVEGDAAFANAAGGQSCQPSINNANIAQTCNDDIRVLATLTARVGYTWLDRLLVFVKAGGAWTHDTLNVACGGDANFFQGSCFPSNNPFPAVNSSMQNLSISDSRFGGTVGVGIEFALTPAWSAKVEYDFLDFGSKSFVLADTTPVTVREYVNELKFGLNYHLNAYDPERGALASPSVPIKALIKVPPPNPYDWSGGYIGVAGVYRMVDAGWKTTSLPIASAFAGFFGPAGTITLPDPTTNPASFFGAAAQGGLFVGYDWQIARRWVTGVEADIAFGDSSMSRGGIPGTFGNGSSATSFLLPGIEAAQLDSTTVKFGWDSSIRARLGYLSTPNLLVYGTGGVAFQQISATAACTANLGSYCGFVARAFAPGFTEPPRSETVSTVRTGWTAGGGLEGVLSGNWLGRAEFRYADFGHFNHKFFAGTIDEVDVNLHPQTYTFLAGIGYKFNGTGNPLTP
jgi:opacity protein-like surface antigen